MSMRDGSIVAKAGRSGSDDLEFEEPCGLALAECPGHGATLYVVDSKNHRIKALDPADLSLRFTFGKWGIDGDDGSLREPTSLAAHGDLLAVADTGNKRVVLFGVDGQPRGALGSGVFKERTRYVGLGAGHLFVVEDRGRGATDRHGREAVPEGTRGAVVFVFSPHTRELIAHLVPPHNTNRRGEGMFNGMAVFGGVLYLASGFGRVIALRKDQEQPPGAGGKTRPAADAKTGVEVS